MLHFFTVANYVEGHMKRFSRRWLVLSGVSIIAELYLLFHFSELLLAFMFLVGRSDCSLQQTLTVMNWKRRYEEAKAQMAGSRLLRSENGLELWATPRGEFWMPAGGAPTEFGNLAEQELSVYGLGPSGVHPGDIVIDCGADIGTFTRSALAAGASRVIAVEPAPQNESCLRRNFEGELAEGRVTICAVGVWNKEEVLPLSGGSVALNRGPSRAVVRLTTLDSLAAELKLNRVDFIKMDIEGAEKQALQGARQVLLRFKPRLAISTEHLPSDSEEIPRLVLSLVPGYSVDCGPCVHWGDRFKAFVIYFH